MKCPGCQHENTEDARFCNQCGEGLGHICPECGRSNPSDARFCDQCGKHLGVAPLQAPSTPANPESEPPRAAATTGERRQATVVFSDISGYTALNEHLDPEEVEDLLSRIKARADEIVGKYGGIVNQFVGDEVLALFGVPAAHDDDPVRAVRAARELHEMVTGFGPEVEGRIGTPLRLHTGIATGLLVTHLGDRRDGTYGITGETVITGARLKATAKEDELLVNPETHRRIRDFFITEALPAMALKGQSRPMVPHRVLEETEVTTRFQAATMRGLTPFFGRREELEALTTALDDVIAGKGRLVGIVGEAGQGKSRLVHEFRGVLAGRGIGFTIGRCHSQGHNTPYLPWLEAFQRGMTISIKDDPGSQANDLILKIRSRFPELENFLPHYLYLLTLPQDGHPLPRNLEGEVLRLALEESLRALIIALCQRHPLVLILEDWQWVDPASDAFLGHLEPLLRKHQVMVVFTSRVQPLVLDEAAPYKVPVRLPPLTGEDCGQIACQVLDATGLPEGLAGLLFEHTGGNPFFVEETCRVLRETGMVRVREGQVELDRPLDELSLPGTVDAVLHTRLDRLPHAERETLRMASVIGRRFSREVLARLLGDATGLDEVLGQLMRQNLIRPVESGEDAYAFRHALLLNVVYETLLLQQRRELHGKVARIFEQLNKGHLESQYEVLAHHFANSDQRDQAIHYLELAGDKASGYSTPAEAGAHYREAIHLLDSGTPNKEDKARRIDINLKWAAASFYTAGNEQREAVERSHDMAVELGDERRRLKTLDVLGRMEYSSGNFAAALERFQACINLAEDLDDEGLLAMPLNVIGRTCVYQADYARGIDYLRRGIPMMAAQNNPGEVAWSKSILAVTLGWTGRFAEAMREDGEALRTAARLNVAPLEAACLMRSGMIQASCGKWNEAISACTRAIELAGKINNQIVMGISHGFMGYAQWFHGEQGLGLDNMAQGIATLEEVKSRLVLSLLFAWQAEIMALSGLGEAGEASARRALELAAEGERFSEATARRALGLSLRAQGAAKGKANNEILRGFDLARERDEMHNAALADYYLQKGTNKRPDNGGHAEFQRLAEAFGQLGMDWWKAHVFYQMDGHQT